MDLGISGKGTLVTGGSQGIGRSCAPRLAAESWKLMIDAQPSSLDRR